MGRQINYYMDKQVESNFVEFILDKGYKLLYCALNTESLKVIDTMEGFLKINKVRDLYEGKHTIKEYITDEMCRSKESGYKFI